MRACVRVFVQERERETKREREKEVVGNNLYPPFACVQLSIFGCFPHIRAHLQPCLDTPQFLDSSIVHAFCEIFVTRLCSISPFSMRGIIRTL